MRSYRRSTAVRGSILRDYRATSRGETNLRKNLKAENEEMMGDYADDAG